MADVASITLVQAFTYRDAYEEWSNRYHVNGDGPSDDAGWQALGEAIYTALKPCLPPAVSLVRAYGYLSDTTDSVSTIDWAASPLSPIAGTQTSSTRIAAGDSAMTCRWPTGRRNSKGHPIYLRKYFHGVAYDGDDQDKVDSGVETALQTFATAMLAELGSTGLFMAGPDGVVPTGASASPWVTTRTLKRRGRRPPS